MNRKWILIVSAVVILLVIIPIILAFAFLPNAYLKAEPKCHNTFASLNYTSSTYQAEVMQLLESKRPGDFRYFFKTFVEEGKSVYMIVNFRNDTQCFDGKIKVDKWNKLAGMKRTNGVSFPNELYDLEWKIVKTKNSNQLVYVDMHRIID